MTLFIHAMLFLVCMPFAVAIHGTRIFEFASFLKIFAP